MSALPSSICIPGFETRIKKKQLKAQKSLHQDKDGFSSVSLSAEDGMAELGKAHTCSATPFRSPSTVAVKQSGYWFGRNPFVPDP